jgi:hypothetical protein
MASITPGSSNPLKNFNKNSARSAGNAVRKGLRLAFTAAAIGWVGFDFSQACTYTSGPVNILLNTVNRMYVQTVNVAQIPVRAFMRGEDPLIAFRENTWPTRVLVCQKTDNADLSAEQQLEREKYFAEMERRLREQVDSNAGQLYNKLKAAIDRREHPVVFLPLPGSSVIDVISYPNKLHQACATQPERWNGERRSEIPVSRFEP